MYEHFSYGKQRKLTIIRAYLVAGLTTIVINMQLSHYLFFIARKKLKLFPLQITAKAIIIFHKQRHKY